MTSTRFEDTSGSEVTSLADEEALYSALAPTGRVQVETMGMSHSGTRPVRLVTVDTPETPADAPSVLWIGCQHGDEIVGREAILSLVRDLAETTDPALVGLLARCRFHAIPTANPDGFPSARNVPGTGGMNMNREYISLAVPESRWVQTAITQTDATVILDCHEYTSTVPDFTMLPGQHPEGDTAINALSTDLLNACFSALTADGIPNGRYHSPSDDPGILSVSASVRSRVALLLESARHNTPWVRFGHYQVTVGAILDWIDANIEGAASERQAAAGRAIARADAGGQFRLSSSQTTTLSYGYMMDSPPPDHLDVYGLQYVDNGVSVTVPLAQTDFAVIPFLLDPNAPEPATAAVAVQSPPPADPVVPFRGTVQKALFRDARGMWRDVESVHYYDSSGAVREASFGL